MILAAGLGTRLGEVTRDRPKALVEVHGRPLLGILLDKLQRAGYDEVVVNIHHHAGMIREWVGKHTPEGMEVLLSEEKERPLETGGGIKHARELLIDAGSCLLHNVDILTDLSLASFHEAHDRSGALVTLAVSRRTTTRYLLADDEDRLCGWENTATGEKILVRTPAGTLRRLGYSGVAAVSREALFHFPDEEVFSLTPFFLELAREHTVNVSEAPQTYWYDAGKPGVIEEVEKKISPERLFS